MSTSIELSELIEQVKKDLLTAVVARNSDTPLFLVESVELDLQVTAKREGKGGIKVDVVSIGGGELGGGVSREQTHSIKVRLSPLLDKAQLLAWYRELRGDDIMPAIKRSMDAFIKGDESDIANRY
ncbi:MAG: trypco2 family protein [Phormidesmis sp.]